ncbi:hypothetical protein QQF64_025789 [Cirrhinus molitorella]|uniref:Coiled-coil domain containing 134 n=1 Tax=Cirrhinus molitorella TaxID=172907 RepID=A0ABR3NQ19_9TELE
MLSVCSLLLLAAPAALGSDSDTQRPRHDSNLEIYKRLFESKRKDQLNALKNLVDLNDINQQYKIIDIMLKGLFKVLEDSKAVLIAANVQPEDRSHSTTKSKKRTLMWWRTRRSSATWLCVSRTGVFSGGAHQHVLTLMSQELGITDKSADFVNPYRTERDDMLHTAEAFQKILREEEKRRRKEEKRKEIRKGPRISRSRTEL